MATTAEHLENTIRRIETGLIPESPRRTASPPTRPLAERMATHGIPGVSIAVVDRGELAWARGYGRLEAGGAAPVTERTLFQAASISKPVTAIAVMRLVQDGRLDLDQDVNRYLRSWQIPATGSWQPRLTLRHLLSHTGGTTVHGFPGYRPGDPVPTALQVLDGEAPSNTPAIRVTAIPGVGYRYSGGGTTIVHQLLVDLLDTPFPDLMHDLVLAPLGMTDSTYTQPLPEHRRPHAARGHRTGGDPIPAGWAVYPEMGAAGLWTTPTDLARVALELQRARRDDGGEILSTSSVDQMLTPWFGGPCGLGFFLAGEGPTLRFGHTGGNEGFRCELQAYADLGAGVIAMTNGDMGSSLYPEILGAVAREYGWPLAPGDDFGTYRPPRTPEPIEAEVLAAYAGDYELRTDFRLRITTDGAALTVHLPNQSPVRMVAASDTTFISDALDAEVTFTKDETGAVTGLKLKQDETDSEARRLPSN
jgi:CubicO group peptidase (beta-lactamase class C family)